MVGIEKNVSIYLEEVGVDSDEHKKYLEKLNRVLEEMKSSTNGAERKYYFSFKETIDSFERYLTEKKIKLTSHEKDLFGAIAGSALNKLAKKRMAEDLIHQVKDRISGELEFKAESGKRNEDIAKLKKTGFWFTDWFRLTKFALEFGTITLFTHQYTAESFDVIRLKAAAAHKKICVGLKEILDGYYYYLSVLEYNSIVKFLEMGSKMDTLASRERVISYSPMEILKEMNDFSAVYIAVMRNLKSIDKGLSKVFKEHQPVHGFMGYVGFLTDRQVFDSRAVRQNERDIITGTITGALYSYYTAYLGIRVSTFNQLMFIVSCDGVINNKEKEYTSEAAGAIKNESNEQITEGSKIQSKLSELVNLTTKYRDMGRALSKRLFELEARSSINAWNKDAQIKPFFKIMKVYDAYLKYILELIINSENFDLEYDNNVKTGYFENFSELVKAVDDCRLFSLELQGARGKDLQNYKLTGETDNDEFVTTLMMHENPATLTGEKKLLRETLNILSARCYNVCMRFNDLINKFYKSGKIESGEITENYDFLLNAKIIHPKVRNLEHVLNKKEVYLIDLLEAGCSIAEYFAEILKNKAIKSVNDEVLKLKKELDAHNIHVESAEDIIEPGDSQSAEQGLNSEADKIYIDALTGFKKWEYFEDFIFPENYDENGNYTGDKLRNVFCAELSNLVDVNRLCGNDSGDRVYKKLSEIINETLRSSGINNVVLRGEAGLIIGYINGLSVVESVDLLSGMLSKVKEYSIKSGVDSLPDLIFNAGIYSEKKGTNASQNMEIARSIMFLGSDGKAGHVAFLRNPDLIVSDKDFDRRGRLQDGLISILS